MTTATQTQATATRHIQNVIRHFAVNSDGKRQAFRDRLAEVSVAEWFRCPEIIDDLVCHAVISQTAANTSAEMHAHYSFIDALTAIVIEMTPEHRDEMKAIAQVRFAECPRGTLKFHYWKAIVQA